MDPRQISFLLFVLFSLLSLSSGFLAARRGILGERAAHRIHFHTVLWTWAPVSLIAFWKIRIDGNFLTIMLLQPLFMALGAGSVWILSRLFRLSRSMEAVLVLAGAFANQGFTMGAYIAYLFLSPAETALGYAIAYVTSMQLFMVLLFYPVASLYSRSVSVGWRALLKGSFLDLRAMPLHAAIAGFLLNGAGVPMPKFLGNHLLLDLLFYAGTMGGYAGIGITLRMERTSLLPHSILAVVRFLLLPAVAWILLRGISLWTGHGPGLAGEVILLESFMPAAIATVVVANLFRLDARAASSLWFWNTILFLLFLIPVLLWGLPV